MANIFATKHDRQSVKGIGKYKGSPTLSLNLTNLVHKWLNTGPELLVPTLSTLFCLWPTAHALSRPSVSKPTYHS